MSQKLPVNGFEWVGYFLEVEVEYLRTLFHLRSDLPFLPEMNRIENVISLFVMYMAIKTMLFI